MPLRSAILYPQLTWMNMLVSGAALLLACAAFIAYDVLAFRASMVRNLSTQAQIIGSNSVPRCSFTRPAIGGKYFVGFEGCSQHFVRSDLFRPMASSLPLFPRSGGYLPTIPSLLPATGNS